MSAYSINILPITNTTEDNLEDEITEEKIILFANRDKSSSKRVSTDNKIYCSPSCNIKMPKSKSAYKESDNFKQLNDLKSKALTEGIKLNNDKINELEAELNNLMINGTDFDDAFEKLINKKLIVVEESLKSKNDDDKIIAFFKNNTDTNT